MGSLAKFSRRVVKGQKNWSVLYILGRVLV